MRQELQPYSIDAPQGPGAPHAAAHAVERFLRRCGHRLCERPVVVFTGPYASVQIATRTRMISVTLDGAACQCFSASGCEGEERHDPHWKAGFTRWHADALAAAARARRQRQVRLCLNFLNVARRFRINNPEFLAFAAERRSVA